MQTKVARRPTRKGEKERERLLRLGGAVVQRKTLKKKRKSMYVCIVYMIHTKKRRFGFGTTVRPTLYIFPERIGGLGLAARPGSFL